MGGEAWGPLILRERVGAGAFGEVYRAWDPALRHEVALKRLRLPDNALPSFRAAVLREGQLLARVKHPNVVVVHGACQVAGEIGIWTEFLHGKTLEQVVKDEGSMSAPEATVVGDCLCRAVAAVHAAGLEVPPAAVVRDLQIRKARARQRGDALRHAVQARAIEPEVQRLAARHRLGDAGAALANGRRRAQALHRGMQRLRVIQARGLSLAPAAPRRAPRRR